MTNTVWNIRFSISKNIKYIEKILFNLGCDLKSINFLFLEKTGEIDIEVEGPLNLPEEISKINGFLAIGPIGPSGGVNVWW